MRLRILLAVLTVLGVPVASAQDGTAAKDPRNFTWVDEGVLAVGGGGLTEADVDTLQALGFGAIADFRAEHKDPQAYIESKNMTFLDMPIDSASDISETQLAAFVAWAREQKAAGRVMYIHCTNGWHRAAAFSVAWEMAGSGESYEDAAKDAAQRRPGTTMRAIAGLLDYEASLTGKAQLAVVLVSPLSHPGLNATMPAHVDVYASGLPAVNAKVRVWSEESKLRIEGVTDANGRFTFQYVSPASAFMDHLYARASLDGFVDGADNLDFIFHHAAKSRGPLEVTAERTSDGLRVVATHGGKALPIRVVVNADGYSEFESSDRGEVLIRDAPTTTDVAVRVVAWGSEGGATMLAGVAPPPPPVMEPAPEPVAEPPPAVVEPPAPVVEPPAPVVEPPVQSPEPAPPSSPETPSAFESAEDSGHALALRYATAGIIGAALLALYVVLSRRRAGVGRR